MALVKNPTHHKRSKHIDIKYHWLREHTYENGSEELKHCKTEDLHGDVMTKALASEDHNKHTIHISGNEDVREGGFWCLASTLASRHHFTKCEE